MKLPPRTPRPRSPADPVRRRRAEVDTDGFTPVLRGAQPGTHDQARLPAIAARRGLDPTAEHRPALQHYSPAMPSGPGTAPLPLNGAAAPGGASQGGCRRPAQAVA